MVLSRTQRTLAKSLRLKFAKWSI